MIIKTPIADMNHEEWLEERKKTIGGSEIGAILGMNPWQSAYSLWAERTGRTQAFDGNLQSRLGTYLEDFVAKLFEEYSGKRVMKTNFIYRNDEYPVLHASPDRLIGKHAGLEIKTTSAYNISKFKGEEFPAQYYAQAVQYMLVTERREWYIAVLIGNSDFRIYHLTRDKGQPKPPFAVTSLHVDEGEMQALYKAAEDFMDCLNKDIPPEMDGSSATEMALAEQYPTSGAGTKDLFGREKVIAEYMHLGLQMKELEERQKQLKNTLCGDLGDHEKGLCGPYTVSWKTVESSRLDSKKLKKDHPEIAAQYMTTSASRRFEIK